MYMMVFRTYVLFFTQVMDTIATSRQFKDMSARFIALLPVSFEKLRKTLFLVSKCCVSLPYDSLIDCLSDVKTSGSIS